MGKPKRKKKPFSYEKLIILITAIIKMIVELLKLLDFFK